MNECVISKGECGYCGIRKNKNGKLSAEGVLKGNFSFFFDNLPTNCVSYQVCAGCTGAGYPRFSCCPSCELQNKSMGVFLNSCSFNCAFCQNYNFLENIKLTKFQNSKVLVNSIKKDVSCVCFFGGDPSTQLPFTVKVANESLAENKGRILRFCWETNGTMNEKLLDEILGISLKTGGCVKFDIKMFDERLSIALTGITNKRTLSNFARAAKWFEMRKTPPLVTASTLLIPCYIEETEVKNIS